MDIAYASNHTIEARAEDLDTQVCKLKCYLLKTKPAHPPPR